MLANRIQEKGILAKLLEKGIKILLNKECKKIGNLKIDIIGTSIQIIKGIIKKISIIAEDVNYKDLLFDKIELESNEAKVIFKIDNQHLKFENDPIIKFKISLSENSLKTILFSKSWNWIAIIIANEVLNQNNLEDIKIKQDQLLMESSRKNTFIPQLETIDINVRDGKIYLINKNLNNSIKIPLEDKVCIENVIIKNNILNIFAKSSISF